MPVNITGMANEPERAKHNAKRKTLANGIKVRYVDLCSGMDKKFSYQFIKEEEDKQQNYQLRHNGRHLPERYAVSYCQISNQYPDL